jgi:N-acetyl-anhydromuramyl-L-alanine amidase AmpD
MNPESMVATAFVESLGSRTGKYSAREQNSAVHAIVVHTTGSGPITRWKSERNTPGKAQATPFLTAVQRTYHTIMSAGPHYVVGQQGECIQLCRESLAAWHVGGDHGAAYQRSDWLEGLYEWWAERWPGLASPRELAGGHLWDHDSCNANTIGIEVVPPVDDVRNTWSPACRITLERLVRDVAARHGLPVTREFVVTHSDAHPISRTDKNGVPWDPGPLQWAEFPAAWTAAQPPPALVG